MPDVALPELESTVCNPDLMFDVLEATDSDVIAVRVRSCTTEGFSKLYDFFEFDGWTTIR